MFRNHFCDSLCSPSDGKNKNTRPKKQKRKGIALMRGERLIYGCDDKIRSWLSNRSLYMVVDSPLGLCPVWLHFLVPVTCTGKYCENAH